MKMALAQVYEDIHRRLLQEKSSKIFHSTHYECEWVLWDIWKASGYSIQKMPSLQGIYIDFDHLDETKTLFQNQYGSRSHFSVVYHFGNIIKQDPDILQLIEELKSTDDSGSKEARKARIKLRRLGHSGGLIESKKATGGLCLLSVVFRVDPQGWIYPMVSFRSVEVTRRFLADIGMVDNVLRWVTGSHYSRVRSVEMCLGLPWIASYNIPVIASLLPDSIKYLHPDLKNHLTSNSVKYKMAARSGEIAERFRGKPMIKSGRITLEFKAYKPRDFIIRG